MKFDINSAEYYCGIDCIPDNVFEGSRTFGPWGDDLEIRSKESWNCALNKNISAECLMYMDIHGDTGRQAPSYRALIKAENRTIMVSVIPKKNGKMSLKSNIICIWILILHAIFLSVFPKMKLILHKMQWCS